MSLIGIAIVAGKAEVDAPTCIAGVIRVRETHRKGSEAVAWAPTSCADQLIECGMENRRVRRRPEWLAAIPGEPDYGPCPCRRIVWVARDVAPHDGAAFRGQFAREGPVDPPEPVLDELIDPRVAQRMHANVPSEALSTWMGINIAQAGYSFSLAGQRPQEKLSTITAAARPAYPAKRRGAIAQKPRSSKDTTRRTSRYGEGCDRRHIVRCLPAVDRKLCRRPEGERIGGR